MHLLEQHSTHGENVINKEAVPPQQIDVFCGGFPLRERDRHAKTRDWTVK
jgi:hypothetical protein